MGSDDTTPVFAAIEYNHLECLSLLLECTNVDMNRTKNCGCTAWHVAIKKGRLECLQKLLEKGIDIERVNESFETAAITATCQVYYLYTTYTSSILLCTRETTNACPCSSSMERMSTVPQGDRPPCICLHRMVMTSALLYCCRLEPIRIYLPQVPIHTIHTIHTIHSTHTIHTIHTIHTMHTIYPKHTIHTIQLAIHRVTSHARKDKPNVCHCS
jgi:hypothetical protein